MYRVAHICRFPANEEIHSYNGGVASYTWFFLDSINHDKNYQHYVLHDQKKCALPKPLEQWWRWRASYFFVIDIIRGLYKIKPHIIHVQWELSLFGPLINNFLLLIILWLCKMLGSKIIVTRHHVLDTHLLTKKFVQEQWYRLPARIIRLATRILYGMAKGFDHHIVHENLHQKILERSYHFREVSVIHHGIQEVHQIDKQQACDFYHVDTDHFVVWFCGYAAAYKNIDILIDGFADFHKQNPDSHLLIGAGKHPKRTHDAAYKDHYQSLQSHAKNALISWSYQWIWFVPDKDLDTFYSACDVLVFPYKHSFSSSWPLALSIAHHKIFVFSPPLFPYFPDLADNVFTLDAQSLSNTLSQVYANTETYMKNIATMQASRKRSVLASSYLGIYHSLSVSHV
jgi:glycosyltransferase involved in cell wall biosynthesis